MKKWFDYIDPFYQLSKAEQAMLFDLDFLGECIFTKLFGIRIGRFISENIIKKTVEQFKMLEQLGLVYNRADEENFREWIVGLTQKGKAQIKSQSNKVPRHYACN